VLTGVPLLRNALSDIVAHFYAPNAMVIAKISVMIVLEDMRINGRRCA